MSARAKAGSDPRAVLSTLYRAAIAAADPARVVPAHLPTPPSARTIVIGAGKGAAAMARAVEDHWEGPVGGLVITCYGHGVACEHVEVVEAAHPVPDDVAAAATLRLLSLVEGLTEDDLVICLVSGGGSSLLSLPAPGLTLAMKQRVTAALLGSGATIAEMNCVRSHLSSIKGGRLALACGPARVVTLAISDVPGDLPWVIASGPTVADPTTFRDALGVLGRYRVCAPEEVRRHLERGASGGSGAPAETPKPGDERLGRCQFTIVARAADALAAASKTALSLGLRSVLLGDDLEGEARIVAGTHARLAKSLQEPGSSARLPCVLLSGGETTVTVQGQGRGGRNTEYLLGLALALDGRSGVHALAADTDGIDGSEANAGAFVGPETLDGAARLGLDPAVMLADNDAYSLFERLEDLLFTGPTRTNVNDFRAILVDQGA